MDVEWSFTKGRHTPTTLHSEIGSRSGANDVCSQSSLHSTRSAVDQERSRSFRPNLHFWLLCIVAADGSYKLMATDGAYIFRFFVFGF
ncbi:uncharacterized protein [Zea mays]|uniref:Uncharacterized protein n=1 Tax=Zea mays TaxID=4577 RepID=B4FHL7_MAIZE|nr:uncharacterized protein LOC100194148 [Zea mays]ACF81610.1 unknown [Zea mays]|eukprot:XP_008679057.1 uncharacterized protein LOC100194148 [Zea mays]